MDAAPSRFVLGVVAFGVFIAADDLMVVAAMLRPMIDDLGLALPDDLDSTSWIVNVYLIAYITTMPLAGKLSDVFGRRAVFVCGLGVFIVGSLVVPLAGSLPVLLLGRALSAVGGGALVPVAFAVATDLHAAQPGRLSRSGQPAWGSTRARALGILGAVETLGWVWGPLYGAVLIRFLSWEWQFYLNVPLALVAMAAGWRLLDPTRRAAGSIDWGGAALLTVSLITVNVGLLGRAKIHTVSGLDELTGDRATPWWRGPWLVVIGLAAGAALFVLERRRSRGGGVDPVLKLGFGRDRSAAAALLANALLGVGLVIALVNVPLFVNVVESRTESTVGATAVLVGWLLTALTGAMGIASYLGGLLAGRWGNRIPTVLGLATGSVGMALMGWTWSPDIGAVSMAVELAVVGAGIGLALAPTSDAVMATVRDTDRGSAAALVILCRLVGFSVGLAALTAWGLGRYRELRDGLELPPIGGVGYETAFGDALVDITTRALSETFLGAAAALVAASLVGLLLIRAPVPRDG